METIYSDNDPVNWVGNVLLQLELNNNEMEDLWRPGGPVITRMGFHAEDLGLKTH
jgi:hypothetical protein